MDVYLHRFAQTRKDGKEIAYTITENVKDLQDIGYELESIQRKGVNEVELTNKYDPEHTSVTVLKEWDDDNDRDGTA